MTRVHGPTSRVLLLLGVICGLHGPASAEDTTGPCGRRQCRRQHRDDRRRRGSPGGPVPLAGAAGNPRPSDGLLQLRRVVRRRSMGAYGRALRRLRGRARGRGRLWQHRPQEDTQRRRREGHQIRWLLGTSRKERSRPHQTETAGSRCSGDQACRRSVRSGSRRPRQEAHREWLGRHLGLRDRQEFQRGLRGPEVQIQRPGRQI